MLIKTRTHILFSLLNNTADYLLTLTLLKRFLKHQLYQNKKLISGKMNSYKGLRKRCTHNPENHMSTVLET